MLTICYDRKNLQDPFLRARYRGPVAVDYYGRQVPKHATGTVELGAYTGSVRKITEAVLELFDQLMDRELLSRRLNVTACHVLRKGDEAEREPLMEQLNLFAGCGGEAAGRKENGALLCREEKNLETILEIRKKFGKNAILKAMDLQEGATAMERNSRIGGHNA